MKKTDYIAHTYQATNAVKNTGVKISKKNIIRDHYKFLQENAKVLDEARLEQDILAIKRFYKRNKWAFPPKTHIIQKVVDQLNAYYGEGTCSLKNK